MTLLEMKAGRYLIPVDITASKGRLYFNFGYNKKLLTEIKLMKGRRYHGYDDVNPRKIWSVSDCARNRFQVAYLTGNKPYEPYDTKLVTVEHNRSILFSHQVNMFRHIITRKRCLVSGEMGVGKTLSAIEALEWYGSHNIVWVGTGSSIAAVKLEFRKWKCDFEPLYLTYTKFRMMVNANELHTPEVIVFDECQKLKGHNTEQSKAADKMTEEMLAVFEDPLIIGMSGAPAPNNPCDWWHICEVFCPGYLKEGDWYKFRDRMAIVDEQESLSGQKYIKVITWLDDENKCVTCGKLPEEHSSDLTGHGYQKSKNEVKYLYERMNGLNVVHFKKDCLDLPELQYRVIKLEPTDLMKRAEALILKTVPRTVTALIKLRELSDGFQYKETEVSGTDTCPLCKGSCTTTEWYDPEYPDESPSQDSMESGVCKERTITCYGCEGKGQIPKVERVAKELACPKELLLAQILEEHEDYGRLVVYAGFQASVDRCVKVALENKWHVIQADGRGWKYVTGNNLTKEDMLWIFQDPKKYPEKIAFIGQAGAAGTGLTLTASPSIFFYSNSFNADDRIQAVNRIHRPGMGEHATIIDCVHLDTDQYVLDNLKLKFDLLNLSMGRFRDAVNNIRKPDYEEHNAN